MVLTMWLNELLSHGLNTPQLEDSIPLDDRLLRTCRVIAPRNQAFR